MISSVASPPRRLRWTTNLWVWHCIRGAALLRAAGGTSVSEQRLGCVSAHRKSSLETCTREHAAISTQCSSAPRPGAAILPSFTALPQPLLAQFLLSLRNYSLLKTDICFHVLNAACQKTTALCIRENNDQRNAAPSSSASPESN